ncbi:hypothetical protein HPP92_016548 [Vanilla planifolia]|uniref:Uncharacterized protein n=1 Tax=Vanilla planifolia TaxID=51239 RepID=A0A835QQH4_VANPL|nr:hypothetical protein HPP92_016548 [Vanilla planifolia]
MGKAPCCDKANVKKGPWSPEEDAKLKSYIEQHGTGGNWIALPHKIGLKRCGKSCRLRWLNYLRPNIRHGSFTEEEDQIICNLYISIGSRWSIIAAQLPGRTDNDIKNYWNTRLRKKVLGARRDNHLPRNRRHSFHSVGSGNPNIEPPQNISASAMERLQLHMQLIGLSNPFSFYNVPVLENKNSMQTLTTDAVVTTASPIQQLNQPCFGVPTCSSSSSSNADVDLHDLVYGKENEPAKPECFTKDAEMGWWESAFGLQTEEAILENGTLGFYDL